MRSALTLPKAHLHVHLDGAARPETMLELAGRAGLTGVSFGTCDVCPTSNVRLGVGPDVASHPIRRMIEAGVPVTINADDPLQFVSDVGDEYEFVRRTFELGDEELAGIAGTCADASGATSDTRIRIRAGVDAWLASEPAAL